MRPAFSERSTILAAASMKLRMATSLRRLRKSYTKRAAQRGTKMIMRALRHRGLSLSYTAKIAMVASAAVPIGSTKRRSAGPASRAKISMTNRKLNSTDGLRRTYATISGWLGGGYAKPAGFALQTIDHLIDQMIAAHKGKVAPRSRQGAAQCANAYCALRAIEGRGYRCPLSQKPSLRVFVKSKSSSVCLVLKPLASGAHFPITRFGLA